MLPFKRDKVDLSKLSSEEQRIFALYGKIPAHKGLKKMQERKYFDSGDYALSKAGRAPQSIVGTAIPNPENIPHASNPGNSHNSHNNNGQKPISISPTNSTSPVNKESGLANDENTNVPEYDQLPGRENSKVTDENSKVPEHEQLPESGKETVVDETTTEDETTGQGPAR